MTQTNNGISISIRENLIAHVREQNKVYLASDFFKNFSGYSFRYCCRHLNLKMQCKYMSRINLITITSYSNNKSNIHD